MLVGFHGKAGSGKDQSCQFIQEWGRENGHEVRREAFADRLKLSAARALGFTEGGVEEAVAFCNQLKREGVYIEVLDDGGVGEQAIHSLTGRAYLQYYGTEAHREVFDTDFWISAVMDTYEPSEILVVTDVRFPNEAEAIRAAGGFVVHLVRPGHGIGEGHASEKPLSADLVDVTIENIGDLEDLQAMVTSLVRAQVTGAGI